MTLHRHSLFFMLSLTLLLGGCVDNAEETNELNLGSVSFGDQLVDLKAAFEAGAISAPEYRQAKDQVLSILDTADTLAAAVGTDKDDDSDGQAENGAESRVAIDFDTRNDKANAEAHNYDKEDDNDEDDDDNGWIF